MRDSWLAGAHRPSVGAGGDRPPSAGAGAAVTVPPAKSAFALATDGCYAGECPAL